MELKPKAFKERNSNAWNASHLKQTQQKFVEKKKKETLSHK
jgi:hypothetical protein